MHATQYLELYVTYGDGLIKNTGNQKTIVVDKDTSFIQSSMSSPLVLDFVKFI